MEFCQIVICHEIVDQQFQHNTSNPILNKQRTAGESPEVTFYHKKSNHFNERPLQNITFLIRFCIWQKSLLKCKKCIEPKWGNKNLVSELYLKGKWIFFESFENKSTQYEVHLQRHHIKWSISTLFLTINLALNKPIQYFVVPIHSELYYKMKKVQTI